MTIEQIIDLFKNKSTLSYKSIYNLYKEDIDALFFYDIDYKEKIWLILNNQLEPPKCICGKNKSFEKYSKGYRETCLSKKCINSVKNKSRIQTCIFKYNTEHHSQNSDCKEKKEKTNLKKYGTKHALQSECIKKKIKDSMIKNHGVDNPMKSDDIKNRMKSSSINKWGKEYPSQTDYFKNKVKSTNFDRYGVEYLAHSKEIRSKMAKSSRISSLERKMMELLKNRNLEFEHQYIIEKILNGNKKTHAFDFAIFSKSELICLVECDGAYYHGYINDQDGKKINIDNEMNRMLFIPENVKFITILENDFDKSISELFKCLDMNYEEYIKHLFDWCRSIEFPYPEYDVKKLNLSYLSLCKFDKFSPKCHVGYNIIRHFHKSIYNAKTSKNISPFDAWYNDEMLLKGIKNRIIYKNRIDPSRILDAFSIAKIAPKVSVFQPFLAKNLIQKYLNYEEIFDPFSGFSGRMLGAASLGKKYIGQDINIQHVKESNEIISFFDLKNIKISCEDSTKTVGKFESLFTCPPYGEKESWNKNEMIKSCDEWIDICIQNFDCKKYLFVIDKTDKYIDYIVETIDTKSHFSSYSEIVILIEKN